MTYQEKIAGLGELTPDTRGALTRDAELLHDWVTRPRNSFWGMGSHTLEQVREIYAFVESMRDAPRVPDHD